VPGRGALLLAFASIRFFSDSLTLLLFLVSFLFAPCLDQNGGAFNMALAEVM
jgi:hypothetical protein